MLVRTESIDLLAADQARRAVHAGLKAVLVQVCVRDLVVNAVAWGAHQAVRGVELILSMVVRGQCCLTLPILRVSTAHVDRVLTPRVLV